MVTKSYFRLKNCKNYIGKVIKSIKTIKSFNTFVTKLRKFLIQKCYYTLDEYNKEIWQC